jgi:hypothetical protein
LSRAFFGGIGTAALTHRAVSFSFGMWVCFQKKVTMALTWTCWTTYLNKEANIVAIQNSTTWQLWRRWIVSALDSSPPRQCASPSIKYAMT